jgi:hypothetical protein
MTFSEQPPFFEDSPAASPITLPDSIREHRKVVNLLEWIKTRHPANYALNAKVRQRLGIKAA